MTQPEPVSAAWKRERLGDLPVEIIDGDRSSRYPKRSEFQSEGMPFLNSTNIDRNRIDLSSANLISLEKYAQIKKGRLRPMDIVMTTRGTIGKVALFNDRRYSTGLINAQMLIMRADGRTLDQLFLFYYLCSRVFQDLVRNFASGAAQPQIPIRDLIDVPVSYPPLSTQRRIVAILSAYDDLIENNTRRIAILEEIAQNLYREWFVHFRYPGHEDVPLVDSPLGPIAKGWEPLRVESLVNRLPAGNTYRQSTVSKTGSVPVIDQSRSIVLGYHSNEPDHKAAPDAPIIIFGDHTCKIQLMIEPFSLGPNVVPFTCKQDLPVSYLYFLVSDLVETHEYKRHWTELMNKEVVVAPRPLAVQFEAFVAPIFQQAYCQVRKNAVLRRTRDLLLPRLISGQLDVSDLPIDTGGSDG